MPLFDPDAKRMNATALYRHKRMRPSKDNFLAFDLSLLEDDNADLLKEEFKKASTEERGKIASALFAVYGVRQVAQKLGIHRNAVLQMRRRNPDVEMAALIGRNLSIVEMAERKVFKLIESLDVSKVEDRDKAKSAKLLAEVADLQLGQVFNKRGGESHPDEDVDELVLKIKRRRVGDGVDGKTIDITGDVEVGG